MKKIGLSIMILGLLFVFTNCDLEYDYVIREKFRGKWETEIIRTYGWLDQPFEFTLPANINDTQINFHGWLIEANAITLYRNGEVFSKIINVCSDVDGNIIYKEHLSGSGIFFRLYGDSFSLYYQYLSEPAKTDIGKKVNKFSWE